MASNLKRAPLSLAASWRKQARQNNWEHYSCGRKIPYETPEAAGEVAIDMEIKYGYRYNVYHCDCCDQYHVGKARW